MAIGRFVFGYWKCWNQLNWYLSNFFLFKNCLKILYTHGWKMKKIRSKNLKFDIRWWNIEIFSLFCYKSIFLSFVLEFKYDKLITRLKVIINNRVNDFKFYKISLILIRIKISLLFSVHFYFRFIRFIGRNWLENRQSDIDWQISIHRVLY